MKLPPSLLRLHIRHEDDRTVRLWLPLFLLWPLVLVLVVLALIGTLLADVVLLVLGHRYHHYTRFLMRSLALLAETRGTAIHVDSPEASFHMTLV